MLGDYPAYPLARKNPHDRLSKISNSAFYLNSITLEGATVFHSYITERLIFSFKYFFGQNSFYHI